MNPCLCFAQERTFQEKVGVLLRGSIAAGFPSPAEEVLSDCLTLDELLISNRVATFFVRVTGDSMVEAGILPGDLVIVDRSLAPRHGDVVIAEVDGAWTMKIYHQQNGLITLVAANPHYAPIRPKESLRIAGVVTGVVRKYR